MEEKFNAAEIFEIAEKAERDGSQYYLRAAELAHSPRLRDLYNELSKWELRHEQSGD